MNPHDLLTECSAKLLDPNVKVIEFVKFGGDVRNKHKLLMCKQFLDMQEGHNSLLFVDHCTEQPLFIGDVVTLFASKFDVMMEKLRLFAHAAGRTL